MFLLQVAQMLVIPFVRQIDQPLVEEFLADATLRTTAENHSLLLRIEGKGEPPLHLQHLDAQFLHVRVF
ncbi:hypothetical protein LL06_04130 [Hoeflea sp. BAL378]|nr:hypothetical protein LL06_04130 [Hoeflea sp. BAL378]